MQISSITEIRPVGAEVFHVDEQRDGRTDGQTDRQTDKPISATNLIVAFRNFANTPKHQPVHA